MKNKLISVLSIIFLFTIITSCKKDDKKESLNIYILQIRDSFYLGTIRYGIMDEIKSQNMNVNIAAYTLENTNLSIYEIAKKINKKKDIVIALGDDMLSTAIDTFPTNPIISAGILELKSINILNTTKKENGNIAGVYYMPDISLYIDFLTKIVNIRRLGYIEYKGFKYTDLLKDRIEVVSKINNVKYINYEINDVLDIKNELRLKKNMVDALIVVNNIPISSVYQYTIEEAYKNDIPVISFQPSSNYENFILFSISPNYYRMGRIVANMTMKILNGENIDMLDNMDMRLHSDLEIVINKDVAHKLNVRLNEDAMALFATKIIEDGKMRTVIK